jgi:hypothetical protein
MAIATYSFLPWLRRGISNQLTAPAGTGASRATVAVTLAVTSDQARTDLPPVTVRLVGPGDVTGMESRQVIRTEPRAGVSDFEPNYLAAIEFYDEDFPWRYAPLAPDTSSHRLPPWIALVVLADSEFTRKQIPDRPLPSFVLTSSARRADVFPPPGQEWAWAHAHINGALPGTTAAPDLVRLGTLLDTNPDSGYARLLCLRRLAPNTSYTAFVIPVFETGRRAGLGEPLEDTDDGLARSWQGPAEEFPIYFEWSFRTGIEGDFESLVRALVPRDMDPRVGIREMSISHPGFGIDAASNPPDDDVGLEGALLAPTTIRKGLTQSSDFVTLVSAVLNAAADAREAGDGDPLVAPPIYGCWHARVERVGSTLDNAHWVDGLSLDPRYRAAAGLGARVIRTNQERYVRAAWEQIGDVLTVNRRIRQAQLATKAASAIYMRSLLPLPPEVALVLAAPVFSKVRGSQTTLAASVKASRLPPATVSRAFQKHSRPRGRFFRRLFLNESRSRVLARVVGDINEGRLSMAPPRPPVGGATFEAVGQATGVLRSPRDLQPRAIARIPARRNFRFSGATTDVTLTVTRGSRRGPMVEGDNFAAADMRQALTEFGTALAVHVPEPAPKSAVDVQAMRSKAVAALEPHRAIAARFAPLFRVGRVDALTFVRGYHNAATSPDVETLQEVMNYPDIKDPMYAPLQDISSEYFLPNLKLIPNNTISLLLTNQPFIESYLAGLNHEFARELLWREYPTDQRGSSFRQFWDASNYVDREGRTPKALAEFLKDVPPLHRWQTDSALGAHDQRQTQPNRKTVVLVIRGDLLKRYPNTFIYAQRPKWGSGIRANRLVLSDETGELFATTPNDSRLRFPLYKARIAPDLHFLGFDLTIDEVRGDPRLDETAEARALVGDDVGWFFVIQEAVGEPRFGLDVSSPTEPSPQKWDNLAWADLDLSNGAVIDLEKPFLSQPSGADPLGVQFAANAADSAYILYQDPVMVAVHGRHMLKNLTPVE